MLESVLIFIPTRYKTYFSLGWVDFSTIPNANRQIDQRVESSVVQRQKPRSKVPLFSLPSLRISVARILLLFLVVMKFTIPEDVEPETGENRTVPKVVYTSFWRKATRTNSAVVCQCSNYLTQIRFDLLLNQHC